MKKIISLFIALIFLGGCATDTEVKEDTTDTAVQEITQKDGAEEDTRDTAVEEITQKDSESDSEEETIEISSSFEIDGETEEELSGTYEVVAGTTLLDFMVGEFEVEQTDGFIESINGYAQNAEENIYWLYDINGEMATVGAEDYVLEEGDEISWTLNPME